MFLICFLHSMHCTVTKVQSTAGLKMHAGTVCLPYAIFVNATALLCDQQCIIVKAANVHAPMESMLSMLNKHESHHHYHYYDKK